MVKLVGDGKRRPFSVVELISGYSQNGRFMEGCSLMDIPRMPKALPASTLNAVQQLFSSFVLSHLRSLSYPIKMVIVLIGAQAEGSMSLLPTDDGRDGHLKNVVSLTLKISIYKRLFCLI